MLGGGSQAWWGSLFTYLDPGLVLGRKYKWQSLDGNDEFDEQLQMQELHGNTEDSKKDPRGKWMLSSSSQLTAPYDWDLDEKSLFPKTTEGFVATRQANYGFSNDGVCSSTANVQAVNARDAEEFCKEKVQTRCSQKEGR